MLSIALMLAVAPDASALPGWMAGCWIEERGERWTEECWTAPRGGTMLGSGRRGTGGAVRSWETMQIIVAADGTTDFWGAPSGANRTPFKLSLRGERELVFLNAGHDYPQRIRYWRDGAVLNAETSLADGSKPMRWSYRRMGGN